LQHLGVVEFLLESAGKSLVMALDVMEQTPLHWAAQKGYLDVVRFEDEEAI
jgi:ankyrin repeat protein